MLSLYIHIPFCDKKCSYCNFFMAPLHDFGDGKIYIDKYYKSLISEIEHWSEKFPNQQIKTIYFWWWTPLCLWKDNIISLINLIKSKFNLEFLEEISFELNIDPFDQVLDFVDSINKKYHDFFRIRYSFGIQSFDDEVLKSSNRWYIFNNIVLFLRKLVSHKNNNNVFNFDFIAFWKFNKKKDWTDQLWDFGKINFFNDFINSWFADSFSLYMLELFPWSIMFDKKLQNEESIYQEFEILKNIIYDAWYIRYEISNFSFAWKPSIHNKIYWNMWNYLWVWMWASWFLDFEYSKKAWISSDSDNIKWVRYTNTKSWQDYFDKNYMDKKTIIKLDDKNYNIEKFFLWLRTNEWLGNLEQFGNILIKNYMDKIQEYQDKWFVFYDDGKLIFTDKWFDVYNTIITDLLA